MSDAERLTTPDLRPSTSASDSDSESGLVSTREAARLLGRNVRSVRRAIERGDLPALKLGSAYRIASADLMRYAAHSESRAPPPRPQIVALPTAAPVNPALPEPLSSFVGRTADVAAVCALLAQPAVRLLTLTGSGGIGKTRLALAAAAAARDQFPDGVAFIGLAAVSRPEQVIPAIGQALGLRETARHDWWARLLPYLALRRMLLVIDNVEHLLDATPELALILQHAPRVAVLVTSRTPLRLAGEREYPVTPLSLPAAQTTPTATDLLTSDAARLFIERASARDASFQVDARTAPLIAAICTRLDGLPLAIELAAAQVKLLSPHQLHDRLERRLPLLTSGPRDAPQRHRTMRDAIAWSYGLLSAAEQRIFRHLAVFAGGFTLEAAEAVGGDDFASILELVGSLQEQSLLSRELDAQGEPRFRMLETVREYGLERLGADEAEHARAAHARYFLHFARTLWPFIVMLARQAPLDRMAADDANLRVALHWFDERGLDADFVGLVVACWTHWYAIGRLQEAARWLDRASAKREAASPRDRARLVIVAAELLMLKGESEEAETVFAEGIPLLRETGDPFDLASALISRGASLKFGERYAEAESQFAEALAVAEAIDVPELREAVAGRALGNLGVLDRARGELELAQTHGEASLRCYRNLGLDLAEARAMVDLGEIAREQGNPGLAAEQYVTAMQRIGEKSEARIFADALTGIADVATTWGQNRTAVLLFSTADAIRERGGFAMMLPSDIAAAEQNIAVLRATLGEPAFSSVWAKGRELPLPEAVALAAELAPRPGTRPAQPAGGRAALTRRERDVLRLLAQGQTDRQIAEALFVSPRTVSWHVGTILSKLEAATRHEAGERARTLGLL